MDDNSTPSSIFSLLVRSGEDGVYQDRAVNKSFEYAHMQMFKIVPPTVGSFIYLEYKMRIDAISYKKGKIILSVTYDLH
jgi:hypothetical protein